MPRPEEESLKLLINPQIGIARDSSVRTGGTVYVQVGRKVVNATAITDILSSNVMVMWSEQDSRYYAFSPEAPQVVNESTSEFVRSRPISRPEILDILYIHIAILTRVYSSELKEITQFSIETNNKGTYVYMLAQEDVEIRQILLSPLRDDAEITLDFWNNDEDKTNTFQDDRTIIIRNFDAATRNFLVSTDISKRVNFLQGGRFDQTAIAVLDYLFFTNGFEFPDPVYSGTPANTYNYTYQVAGNTIMDTLTLDRVATGFLGGNFTNPSMVVFQVLIFSNGEDLPFYAFFNSSVPGMWANDTNTYSNPVGGHLRPISLLQSTINTVVTLSDSAAAGGVTYDFFEQKNSTVNFLPFTNGTDAMGNGNYSFQYIATQDYTYQESFSTSEPGLEVDFNPASLNFLTGAYSASINETRNVSLSKIRVQQYTTSGSGGLQQYTNVSRTQIVGILWNYSRNDTESYNLIDTFSFGSLSIPFQCVFSASFNTNKSVATNNTDITTDTVDINVGKPSFQYPESFIGTIYQDPIENASSIHNVSGEYRFPRLLTTNESVALVVTTRIIFDISYTTAIAFKIAISRTEADLFVDDTNLDNQRVLEPGDYDVYETLILGLTLANPWTTDLGYARLLAEFLFESSLQNLTFQQIGYIDTLGTEQRAFLGTSRTRRQTFNDYQITNELTWHDDVNNETITINSDNSMYIEAPLNNFTIIGDQVTFTGGDAFDSVGGMDYTVSGIPSSWFQEITETGDGIGSPGGITTTRQDVIISSNSRKSVADYIGEEFWVFRAQTKRMYKGTLDSAAAGTFVFTVDTDDTFIVKPGSFLTSTNNRTLAITQENLASFFANPTPAGKNNIDRDLAINGKKVFLCYRDQSDDDSGNDEVGFVHRFNIDDNDNLVFNGEGAEITANIYAPFIDGNSKTQGYSRQYTDKT